MFWKILLILNFIVTLWLVHAIGERLRYRKYWIQFRRDGIWWHTGLPGEWSTGIRVIRYPFVKDPNNSEHTFNVPGEVSHWM